MGRGHASGPSAAYERRQPAVHQRPAGTAPLASGRTAVVETERTGAVHQRLSSGVPKNRARLMRWAPLARLGPRGRVFDASRFAGKKTLANKASGTGSNKGRMIGVPQGMRLSTGTRLGPYQILSAIGAGGMGEVYRARDTRLDRTVAIKVLPAHLSGNAEHRHRFEREARIISKLNHPSICVLHDVGHEGQIDFLVMEYLEGESLAERLRRGALPQGDVLRYAIQIVEALAKAHQQGIVHRDLKPANVIVTRDGSVKVLDFGVAAMIAPLAYEVRGATDSTASEPCTEAGTLVGTLAYMSPEQAQGTRVDARSDVFSFGALLYELVTGQRPFQAQATVATLSLILHKEPRPISELVPSVPVALETAIFRCLAKDPSQRFQYMIEIKAVLERVLAEGTPRQRPAHQGGVWRLHQGVRGWSTRVGAGLLLITALAFAIMYYREREQTRNLRGVAAEVFYQMRSLDADLAGVRRRGSSQDDLARSSYRRSQLELEYDRYLGLIGVYAGKTPAERAVMRMARRLGEADLDVPTGFHTLAMSYVEKWRSRAPYLRAALARAHNAGLIRIVHRALDKEGLPRELFLLPLHESGFETAAVGPPTRVGIPKGMWQFTPALAMEYGLTLGPLRNTEAYDALDDRHDAERSTDAAVRYLAQLYSTKAAASGLLVIAAYNAGPDAVIEKLDALPDEPRDRNFWNFYRHEWLDAEALDFVMSIFAAALICEQPDVFDVSMEPI